MDPGTARLEKPPLERFLLLLQRQEAEFAVLAEEDAAVGAVFLGNGDRAGVDEGVALVGGEVGPW